MSAVTKQWYMASGTRDGEYILETSELRKSYGILEVIRGIDFGIEYDQIHGIIGPNGAGKTTLFKLLSSEIEPSSGEIYFKGDNITHIGPIASTNRGIGRSFQISNLFEEMTVRECLRLGVLNVEKGISGILKNAFRDVENMDEVNEKAESIAEEVGLGEQIDKNAEELSHGQRRALEIGITYSTDPDLLLLDEPTAGLATDKSDNLLESIEVISEDMSIVIIEHNMAFLEEVVEHVTVLNQGKILSQGHMDEIREDERVQKVYL